MPCGAANAQGKSQTDASGWYGYKTPTDCMCHVLVAFLCSEVMELWYIELAPGEQLSVEAKPASEAVWLVWEGAATITANNDEFAAGRRSVVFVPPSEPQTAINRSEQVVKLIRCEALA
jgi:mannose-6-phosphate isomerase-like protein (cupin superfamily)